MELSAEEVVGKDFLRCKEDEEDDGNEEEEEKSYLIGKITYIEKGKRLRDDAVVRASIPRGSVLSSETYFLDTCTLAFPSLENKHFQILIGPGKWMCYL